MPCLAIGGRGAIPALPYVYSWHAARHLPWNDWPDESLDELIQSYKGKSIMRTS